MKNKLYYETHTLKAKYLVAKQILDNWTLEQIKSYWFALGYDLFFVSEVIIKFYNEAKEYENNNSTT